MKPHILCLGGEDHVLRLPFMLALRQRGFRVSAAGTGSSLPFSRADLAYHRYYFDRFASGISQLSVMPSIARLIRAAKADLVQTFDTKPNLLAPLAIRSEYPIVRTINGMGWVFSATELRALALRPVYCGLQRLVGRWTAATVFQNAEDQEFFTRHGLLGNGASSLIRGSGIDIPAFQMASSSDQAARALRAQLGLENAKVVITVSRLTQQKGIPTLLKAAAIVHATEPSVRFLLVGPREAEGPFAVDQCQIDQHAPYVIALGARSDVPSLLQIADVFAFPTDYREGIPRVLLEAGLAGLPIVTSRMPGCTDLVSHGWNGYLVAPRDANALAARILELLSDSAAAKNMGRRSIALVQRDFGLDRVVDRYADLYESVLARRTIKPRGLDSEFFAPARSNLQPQINRSVKHRDS